MSDPKETSSSAFYRCRVQPDVATATICSGRRRIPAQLQEQSIDGFTLLVKPKDALRLQVGKTWILKTQGENTRIHAQWMYQTDDGHLQLAVRRLEDLTPQQEDDHRSLAWFSRDTRRAGDSSGNEIAFTGIVLLLLMALSLPGLGDQLGTAPKIQATVRSIVAAFWF